MSVLIAHLTDVHVKTNADPITSRAGIVARAIASEITPETTLVVLAIGGDSAYSGTPDQFAIARRFFTDIRYTLQQERPGVHVDFVAVAGNHDCNFGPATTPGSLPATLTLPDAVAALTNYFEFTQSLHLNYASHGPTSPFFAWRRLYDRTWPTSFSTCKYLCILSAARTTRLLIDSGGATRSEN